VGGLLENLRMLVSDHNYGVCVFAASECWVGKTGIPLPDYGPKHT
jgi:hypothetical protein